MGMFSNKIVNKSFMKFGTICGIIILLSVIGSFIITAISVRSFVDEEIALVGALYQGKNIGDLPLLTGDINQYDYQIGSELLSEYSYGTNTISLFLQYKSVFLRAMGLMFIIMTMVCVIFLYILKDSMEQIFVEIRSISLKLQVDDLTQLSMDSNTNNGDISVLMSTINDLAERSKNYVETLSQDKLHVQKMLTDVSHQLKTPLSAIKMYNEILINKPNIESSKRESFLNLSQEQINRIDWLIQGLLKMSRIEADAIIMNPKEYCIIDTIESAIAPLYGLAKHHIVELIVAPSDDIMLNHDTQWVAEAIGNIIKNGIEHNHQGGYIKIILEETPMTVEVRIKDNGNGISKVDLPHIFKRFYRAKGQQTSGVGIGLALAKDILEKNDGDIYVTSEIGKGSEFVVTFLKKS